MSEMVTGKGRERIIKHIETVDQAIRAEKDVVPGYCSIIEDNISYWFAVEGDIVDSYTRLLEQTDDERIRTTLAQMIEDSKNHMRSLNSLKENFSKILTDEERHARMLQELSEEFLKAGPFQQRRTAEERPRTL